MGESWVGVEWGGGEKGESELDIQSAQVFVWLAWVFIRIAGVFV